jgi:hypothetical protein
MALFIRLCCGTIETEALELGARGADSGLNAVCVEKVRDSGLAIPIESSRSGIPARERKPIRVGDPDTVPVVEGLIEDARIAGDLGDGRTLQGGQTEVCENVPLGDVMRALDDALEGRDHWQL